MEEKFIELIKQLHQEQLDAMIKAWEEELNAHSQSKVQNLCNSRCQQAFLAA